MNNITKRMNDLHRIVKTTPTDRAAGELMREVSREDRALTFAAMANLLVIEHRMRMAAEKRAARVETELFSERVGLHKE